MKNFIFLFLLSFAFPLFINGQSDFDKRRINVVNPAEVVELAQVAEKIYPNGRLLFGKGKAITETEILRLLKVKDDISFKLTREDPSRFDQGFFARHYQQYYKGIKVETGGYTVNVNDAGTNMKMFSPRIFYDIDIDVDAALEISECLPAGVDSKRVQSELLISNEYTDDFRLIYLVYTNNKTSEILWIDAITKEVVNRFDGRIELNGVTPTYPGGPWALNDDADPANNTTTLQTPDLGLQIFEGLGALADPVDPAQWPDANIPVAPRTTGDWTPDALVNSQQNFWVTDQVIPEFQNAGINFGEVHVATQGVARALRGSSEQEAYILVDNFNGAPASLFDVVAHELGHCYTLPFLAYTNVNTNAALHEGIADIFGTYVESFIQGVDWMMGDDDPVIQAAGGNRDLSQLIKFPGGTGSQHFNGRPMGHWYFAISTGIPADDIPAIGQQTAIEILIKAINNLNNLNAGYPEMRVETQLAAEMCFGVCSDEYRAVVNAWDRICVPGVAEICPCDLPNSDPVPDYVYVDGNGNPKNVFCEGETVYLDGSGSINENRYFLSIWQYNVGGFAAGESHLAYSRLIPSWHQGEVGSMINLNEIWDNFQQDQFDACFEYRVQLAVQGECDPTGWNVKEDEVFIVEKPTPDYVYVDGNGNPKDRFCFGETVYLDGSGSKAEDKYFLSIWKYNLGGFAAGEPNLAYSRLIPSWHQGEVGSMINLNEIWANFQSDEFEACHEYRVQLAVQGPCDNGWNVKEDELFIVEHPTPDYVYVDADGNPKNEFCFGETVYLDGSGSKAENKYFLSIWQYNLGGFAAGEPNLAYSRLIPSWHQGEVGSMINLNEIWGNFQTDYFEPGFEYRVQLAVQGECDNGWNVKEDEIFTVVCCEELETCDAKFTVSFEEDEHGNLFFNFNNAHESYYEHSWSVFQHDNQGTGPYTQVASSSNPDFEFVGELGGCYTVFHEVTTPCGSCCYSREICNEGKGEKALVMNEVDCDLLCGLVRPSGLGCSIGEDGYLSLNWNEVPGATGYIISMIFNDPECCGEGKGSAPKEFKVLTNTIRLEFFPICMSWTVTPICEKEKGQTSAKACFNYEQGCGKGPKEEEHEDHIGFEPRIEAEASSFKVFPNPSTGLINFEIAIGEDDKVNQMTIMDLSGKVIEIIELDSSEQREIVGSYLFDQSRAGVYLIQVQLESKVITQKVMLVQ